MTVTQDREIDIFVATKIGSFKHIKYHTDNTKNNKKCIENLVDVKSLQKGDEITCMRWGSNEQTDVLIGRRNQQIVKYKLPSRCLPSRFTVCVWCPLLLKNVPLKRHIDLHTRGASFTSVTMIETYSTLKSTSETLTSPDEGTIIGLARLNNTLLSGASGGVVRVWPDEKVDTGGKLDVMVVETEEKLFATGGEENDLKIFSLDSKQPIFAAKNLAHDWLQLRRPIWVSSACFAPKSGGKIVAVCSRHGYVRLYDSRAQRRPVVNVEFPNMAATCIVPSFQDRNFLVGFGRGQLHQVELRVGRPDKGYKGCVGAVTDIATVTEGRLIVTTCLDRHLRVHNYETKEMVYKQYLTSKLTQVLVQTASSTPLRNQPVEIKQEMSDSIEEVAQDQDDDLDVIFNNMETVGEKPKKKHLETSIIEETSSKRIKPSTEGSTEATSDEAIAKLLRSTEKLKRKREKQKKEKKAKSVFHNA